MKKEVLGISILLALLISNSSIKAQVDYRTAMGVKFYPGAFSIKHFVTEKNAVEGLVYLWQYGSRITGLYEFHRPLPGLGLENLNWYVGVGGHVAFWNNRWEKFYPDRSNSIGIGVDGVIGLDWKIPGSPINLSLDWQPSINLVGYQYGEFGWGGVGIRYVLK